MQSQRQPEFFSLQISEAKRFYLDLNPPDGVALAVVCGGCEHCAPNYEIHRADFPYWSIEFVAQGKGRLILDGKTCDLAPGAIYSYGPGIAQDIISDPRERLVKYFVDFTGQQAQSLLLKNAPAPGTVIQTSAPGEVMGLFDGLIRNGIRETPYTTRLAALLVECLVLKIVETAIPYGSSATPAFATYLRCKQHIENHWLKLRTVEQIARECHVDPSHLCRLFQRFDHRSPYQFLLRLKMNRAAERLRVPGNSVKQIADEIGFSDPFHFSRAFKGIMGVSPSQFAKIGLRR